MVAARKQMNDGKANGRSGDPNESYSGKRPTSKYNYDEAVLKVQEWNEALKCSFPSFLLLIHSMMETSAAPSRPSKQAARFSDRAPSPVPGQDHSHGPLLLPASTSVGSSTSSGSAPTWKPAPTVPNAKPAGINLVEKIRDPLGFALQPPEIQTDNWDDDFEEGISFTKLQGPFHIPCHLSRLISVNLALEKTALEEEKPEAEDNAQTIRPGRSPSLLNNVSLPASPSLEPVSGVEDYSDLLVDEDDLTLQNKLADFKVSLQSFLTSSLP
jgi:hypothetical protein